MKIPTNIKGLCFVSLQNEHIHSLVERLLLVLKVLLCKTNASNMYITNCAKKIIQYSMWSVFRMNITKTWIMEYEISSCGTTGLRDCRGRSTNSRCSEPNNILWMIEFPFFQRMLKVVRFIFERLSVSEWTTVFLESSLSLTSITGTWHIFMMKTDIHRKVTSNCAKPTCVILIEIYYQILFYKYCTANDHVHVFGNNESEYNLNA